MANYVSKLIKTALSEDGYLEKKTNSDLDSKTANVGSNNYTKYARDLDNIPGFYNGKKNGYAWCDVFVDWCFVKAFGVDEAKKLLCHNVCGAGCRYSAQGYKDKGQYVKKSPKIGDQIFFDSANSAFCHTGLVYDVDSKYVYTVEGNTSSDSGVVANGGCVRKKKYSLDYKYINGYGRPKFDPEPQQVSKPEAAIKLSLKGVPLYTSSSAAKKTKDITGTYYVWKPDAANGRIRITNSAANVGKSGQVTGWIDVINAGGKVPFKVKIICGSLNIRKGAGVGYLSVGKVYKGDVYTITETNNTGTWGKMNRGWICIKPSYAEVVK